MSRELWRAYTALRNARAIYDDPFFDPDFARLVGEVREDTRIGVATKGEDVVGVWPLHERPGGWSRPIGGPFSDWHGPIVEPGHNLTAQAFLNGLGLSGMTVFGLQPQAEPMSKGMTRVGANMTDISMGWDAYFEAQQQAWPKHFKKMRRLYRNVERDFSERQLNWDDRSDRSFHRLIGLKQDQFARTGFHDVLKPEWARRLFDRLRNYQGARLRVRLVTLCFDGQHAASELTLQSDTVMHGWLTGFEHDMGMYSPGNMLVQDILPYMPGEGILTYDSGPGMDYYKRHYANFQLPVDCGILRGKTNNAAPARLAGKAWRWGESVMPDKAGELMTRARRRMDQVSLAELSLGARISGVVGALTQRQL
ncbi:MAG: GNAT family N-acetyltransferase [Henriciella sp.]|nr:GNAT family N-acetyltransferase [Henriciella sp.]